MAMDPAAIRAKPSTPFRLEFFALLEELANVSSIRSLRALVSLSVLDLSLIHISEPTRPY